jgi:uncharacterized protein YqeY
VADEGVTLLARLQTDQASARRAQEKERVLLLGMVISEIRNREIELRRDLTEDDIIEVIRKAIKRRRESVEMYRTAGRTDLADREQQELTLLEAYLPAQLDPEIIRAAVREIIAGGAANAGAVMGKVMPRFKGQVDGSVISAIVRDELARG